MRETYEDILRVKLSAKAAATKAYIEVVAVGKLIRSHVEFENTGASRQTNTELDTAGME